MKQLVACSKKINILLVEFNKVPPYGDADPPHVLSREAIVDPGSFIWQDAAQRHQPSLITSDVAFSVRRKCIDAFRLKERSTEEISLTKENLERVSSNIQFEINTCESLKSDLSGASDPVSLGALTMVVKRLRSATTTASDVANILSNICAENVGLQIEVSRDEAPEEISQFRASIEDQFYLNDISEEFE